MKRVALFGILTMMGWAAPAAALIITSQGTALPGGGSCAASGITTVGGGATFNCTGIVLTGHTKVYLGIRNTVSPNGNNMLNADPAASSAAVFRTSSTAASTISYTSTTSVNQQFPAVATLGVTNTLNLTRTAGTGTVVATGGNPGNSATNGDIAFLFQITAAGTFTLDVDVLASDANFSGQACNAVYDPSHVNVATGDHSRVDLQFYWSDCGDGQIDSPEQCDDGGANGSLGSCCTTLCTFKTGGTACTDDGNVCTNDQCAGTSNTCLHPNNAASCTDGLFCNGTDTCSGGSCSVHTGDPCPGADGDGNCSESCNEAADNCLAADPNGSSCTDGLFCNGTDTCSGGACTAHTGDPCPGADGDGNCSESCNEASDNCTAPDPNGSSCTDGLFCNGTDTCSSGACTVHTGDPCPGPDGDGNCSESCNEGSDNCTAPDPNGSSCTDGLFCNGTDTCSSGACTVHTGDPCPGPDGDGNCSESCNEGSDNCTAPDPNGSSCTDGLFCNGTDTCSSGACSAHTGDPCPGPDGDGNCSESCDEASDNCTAPDTNGSSCTDGLFCNGADTCSSGSCTTHAGDPCPGPDGDGNCSESCDEASDSCTAPDTNGSSCTDGLFCNGTDTCSSGACTVHTGDPCPGADGDANCSESCDEANNNCSGADPNGSSCVGNGTSECSNADTCNAGACDDNDVAAGTQCTDTASPATGNCKDAECNGNGVCDQNFANETNGTGCADGNYCTANDTCQAGSCAAGPDDPCPGADGDADCSESCVDTGYEVGNCLGNDPNGSSCAGNGTSECSNADTCNAGTCEDNDVSAGTQCTDTALPATGNCKDAECNGNGTCDQNFANESNGTACADGDFCTTGDTCQTGSCAAGSGDPCPGPDGDTDCSESCVDTGYETGNCNGPDPDGTLCRSDTGECDVQETCSAGVCPADGFEPNGTTCGDPTDTDCDNPDTCNGSNVCLSNNEPANTPCGSGADTDCTDPDSCNGTGTCLANNESPGTLCTDDGETCTTDECDSGGLCTHPAGNLGTECRAGSVGMECDEPEECDGVTPTCPADGVKPNGTLCRGSAGICDVIENCDGVNFDCPADQFEPNTTECRGDTGECDVAENCTGSGPLCPPNGFEPSGTTCGDPSDTDCDNADTCDGSNNCLVNHEPAMTACTSDGETCTVDECDGTGLCQHPAGNSGTECRAAAGLCDLAETCDGTNPTCPADAIRGIGEVCRPDQGECDAQEICDGVTVNCPPDITTPDGTPCGDSVSDTDCSNPDSCLAGACDPNNEPTSVQCRAASAGEACDAAENCDGAGNCPADAPATTSVVCRPSVDVCDVADHCDGSSFDCPADGKSTSVCRLSAGVCDLPDSCDGINDACPADAKSTAECRPDTGACDVAENCDGVGNNCPPDGFEPNGTSCTDGLFCNGAETCQTGVCAAGADPCSSPTNFCEESTDSCLASSCATSPIMTCRMAAKSLLLLKSKTDDTKDRLVWKWIKGAATTQVDFGNPTTSASYALCIYDNTGLVGTMDVPPDSNKWVAIGTKGYKYTDLTADEDGAFKIKVKGNDSAPKSKALVKGRGMNLMDPLDGGALVLPVKVQLVNNSNGICFESNFASFKLNSTSKFKAKSP